MPFIIHRYLQKCKTNLYPPGLADFLRGSLTLISLAEIFNYELYFDYESHPFFKCLTENLKYSKSIDDSIETLECINPITYDNIKENLIQLFQTNNNISLFTNSLEVSPIYKYHHNILKEILIPSKSLSDKINLFLNNTININLPFIICHFRISDEYMGKDKYISDSLFNNLLQHIYTVMEKNNHIPKENIIVITDCYDLKNRLKKYPISMIDSYPVHMGLHTAFEFEDIENTVIEFFLMTKSSKIYSFGIHDSSGFSKIINIIYDIPLINTIVNLNVWFKQNIITNLEMEEADSVVKAVLNKFLERSALGKLQYGVTLDRTDLSTLDWINHTQEELIDAILYLEKLRQEVSK